MEKIIDIIDLIAYEKGLKNEEVNEAIKRAVINTAKKTLDEHVEYDVDIDEKNRELKLFQIIRVCEDEDKHLEEEPDNFIALSEAKEMDEDIELGDELRYELSLDNMSRTAANTLHKELEFHIQRLVEDQLFNKYMEKKGKIVSGSVVRVDDDENTYIEIDEVRAVMPKKNRIKGESYKIGDVCKAILKHVYVDRKLGIQIELSRTTPKFLEELLRLEVPEIKDEEVVVERCSRIPGERAKIAISSINPKIDPVGATVGVKGTRINAVSQELNGENIDCIEYSPIPEMFISRALSPAIISSVKIEETEGEEQAPKAVVMIPGDQKPKAIGKSGINIRLASMLTGYEIELVDTGEVSAGEGGTAEAKEEKKDVSSLMSLFKE